MDDELKNFMEETARADRQRQNAELRCIDTILPDDIAAWLDGLERNINRAVRKLSPEVVADITEVMTVQLRIARKQLRIADHDNLKITVMTLNDNWQRLLDNKSLQAEKSLSKTQSAKGVIGAAIRWQGKEPIKDVIANLAIQKDALDDPIPADELWNYFIGCLDEAGCQPEEIQHRLKNYKRINYRNPETGRNEKIEYQTFRDYLKKARKK